MENECYQKINTIVQAAKYCRPSQARCRALATLLLTDFARPQVGQMKNIGDILIAIQQNLTMLKDLTHAQNVYLPSIVLTKHRFTF